MTTTFYGALSASMRTPGSYGEINNRLAGGLPSNRHKILIIGQKLAAGTTTEGTLVSLLSEQDAITYFGAGSIAQRMFAAAWKVNKRAEYLGMALDDEAGTAAAGKFTFTNTATANATLTIECGPDTFTVPITTGDTPTNIGDNVALYGGVAKQPELMYTPVNVTGAVTFTAKNKGTAHNGAHFAASLSNACGVSIATVAMGTEATGATDPSVDDIDDKFTPLTDVNIIAFQSIVYTEINKLEAYVAEMVDAINQAPTFITCGFNGAYADAVTLQGNVNSHLVDIVRFGSTYSLPFEIAAAHAALIALDEDPAMPQNGQEYPGLHVPDPENRDTPTVIENCLWNGITPIGVTSAGKAYCVRAITSMTTTDGNADWTYLERNTWRTLCYYRKAIKTMHRLKYSRAKITEATAKAIAADNYAVAKALEERGILRNVDDYKDDFTVETDSTDPNRLNCKLPAPVVPGLHILANRIDLVLDVQFQIAA